MSNEQEYIDLFDQNRCMIEEPCAALLNKARGNAYTLFKATGFPTPKEEQYKYTDVRPIFAENYGMNLGRVAAPINPKEYFSCDVPNLHTRQEYIVNDTYYNNTEKDGLPEKAREIMNELKFSFNCYYEEKDSIGKRYRRMDAIGTPYCVTVDHQTLEDNMVTLRDRDTMEQRRVAIADLRELLQDKVSITSVLKKLS